MASSLSWRPDVANHEARVMRCGLIHEVRVLVLPDMRVEMLTRELRLQETADPQMLDMMGLQKSQAQALEYTRHFLEYTRRNP